MRFSCVYSAWGSLSLCICGLQFFSSLEVSSHYFYLPLLLLSSPTDSSPQPPWALTPDPCSQKDHLLVFGFSLHCMLEGPWRKPLWAFFTEFHSLRNSPVLPVVQCVKLLFYMCCKKFSSYLKQEGKVWFLLLHHFQSTTILGPLKASVQGQHSARSLQILNFFSCEWVFTGVPLRMFLFLLQNESLRTRPLSSQLESPIQSTVGW